jgi:hypothetical protein
VGDAAVPDKAGQRIGDGIMREEERRLFHMKATRPLRNAKDFGRALGTFTPLSVLQGFKYTTSPLWLRQLE